MSFAKVFNEHVSKYLVLVLLSLLFLSCKKNNELLNSETNLQLVLISGDEQTSSVNEILSYPVIVKIATLSGIGVKNKIVNVSVINGGGKVNSNIDTTDSNGLVKIFWQLGYIPGQQLLRISSEGIGELIVKALATAKPGSIEILSGDKQSAYPGDTLLYPVTIVIKDSLNNPISGRVIVDSVFSESGKLIPLNGRTTDINGQVSFVWVIGSQLGSQTVRFYGGTSNFVDATSIIYQAPPDQEVLIFDNTEIKYPTNQTVTRTVSLPNSGYFNIEAILRLVSPCSSCSDQNCDPWDRIGYITINVEEQEGKIIPLDLIRFITPFGNSNTYVQDVSKYSSLLTGQVKFNAYISTYVGYWNISLKLVFKKPTLNNKNFLAVPLFVNNAMFPNKSDTSVAINIPKNSDVKLILFTTGHNSKGVNCDEFCKKVNKIFVDGNLIYEVTPWRTDCGNTTLNKCGNPQSVRLSRAGWCPGDIVNPYVIDLGKLNEGSHVVRFNIPDIEQNGGYWRVSLALVAKN